MKFFTENKSQKITLDFFEQIYRQYWRKLYGICYQKLGDGALAEEMVQDIFCSIWERRKTLEIEGPIEHYLIRAAKLEVAAYYRKMARREVLLQEALVTHQDKEDTTEHAINASDLRVQINKALELMPERSREIFYQSREIGISNAEIAAKFFISVKAVEYHISKVLLHLRNNLSDFV